MCENICDTFPCQHFQSGWCSLNPKRHKFIRYVFRINAARWTGDEGVSMCVCVLCIIKGRYVWRVCVCGNNVDSKHTHWLALGRQERICCTNRYRILVGVFAHIYILCFKLEFKCDLVCWQCRDTILGFEHRLAGGRLDINCFAFSWRALVRLWCVSFNEKALFVLGKLKGLSSLWCLYF